MHGAERYQHKNTGASVGLIKKVSELSTLCDIKACIIVYGPKEPKPVVWPFGSEAHRVLTQFIAKLRELRILLLAQFIAKLHVLAQFIAKFIDKKMMNQEGFMRQHIAKLREHVGKHERENRELESSLLLREGLVRKNIPTVSIEEATSLCWLIDTKLKLVYDRTA
ncbi:hypothetical protein Cni_G14570 [Canna indica]|uniref:MADS-box domain-containing protein n=1 Tax=Canna indica TaxID=4628 RepID=A0AAQ3KD48_9LILI|nr:hypothetical protein Cni_G14570 [Canna indica]